MNFIRVMGTGIMENFASSVIDVNGFYGLEKIWKFVVLVIEVGCGGQI